MDLDDHGAPPRPRRTVLVAEDSAGDLALLREAFRATKAEIVIEHAADGLAAMRRLEHPEADAPRIDLLILDLGLPRLDGRGVLARLRTLPRRVPAVVLTGSLRPRDRDDCLRLGAAHYALKPTYFGEWLALARLVAGHLRHIEPSNPHTPTPLGSPTLV